MISDYIKGLQPGQGVNLALRTMHNFAVDGEFKGTLPTATGKRAEYSLTVVRSQDQLMQTLNVAGSVSYSGVFTASASAEFLGKSSLSRYSTYIVAKCVVQYPTQTIERPQIMQEVISEAKQLTKDEFTQKYGTEFLVGIVPGSTYFGILEVESTTEDKQMEIAVAVSGSGWKGASADMSISAKLAKVASKSSTKVFAIREGYPSGQPNPLTPDEMIEQVIAFGKADWGDNNGSVAYGIYQPYANMSNLKFREDSEVFQADKRKVDLELLGRRYVELTRLRNDFDFVRLRFNDYKTGTGVLFAINGQPIKDLSSLEASQMRGLKAEASEDAQSNSVKESSQITMQAIRDELRVIEAQLRKTAEAADACKSWKNYTIPDAYVANIGLPEIYGENMELEQMKASLVPSRTIMLWSGIAEAIPSGWLLCDGTKGTPDLRDRFICGAGSGGPQAGTQGEADSHTHVVDPPSIAVRTSSDGDHQHLLPDEWYNRTLGGGKYTSIDTGATNIDNAFVRNAGSHSHAVTVDIGSFTTVASGSGRPKWYALCYIMKQ